MYKELIEAKSFFFENVFIFPQLLILHRLWQKWNYVLDKITGLQFCIKLCINISNISHFHQSFLTIYVFNFWFFNVTIFSCKVVYFSLKRHFPEQRLRRKNAFSYLSFIGSNQSCITFWQHMDIKTWILRELFFDIFDDKYQFELGKIKFLTKCWRIT